MNIVVILLFTAMTCSAANDCSRKTENGDCCYFPFVYGGETYHECTQAGWHREWCSLTASYDDDKQWGNCAAPCGIKPVGTRIVGGTQAQKDSWPWQAMLVGAGGGSQYCGGSLIDENWVLTAAHCVSGTTPNRVAVRLGAYRIDDTAQEIPVEKIIVHENYHSPVGLAHDMALLKLKVPAQLSAGVGTVCLPDPNNVLAQGKRCYITGWGTLSYGGSQPTYLQEASVPIVSDEQCKASYGSNAIHESMICAGFDAGEVDACQGDSGGPMVCEFGGKWYLEGATSWGNGCAFEKFYGIYAKVRYMKSWILDKISNN